ncbi:hypothetical protein Taro_047657 [Colocasia esculenta]|uniref:Uncharacterized protein n=1 Tax=Colocasia esculenta TaxID=4460 RepID=A0A843WW11_COLES|nr:hypothetical protein [Colocasia esculenta]
MDVPLPMDKLSFPPPSSSSTGSTGSWGGAPPRFRPVFDTETELPILGNPIAKQSSYQRTLTVISRIQSSLYNSGLVAKETKDDTLPIGIQAIPSWGGNGNGSQICEGTNSRSNIIDVYLGLQVNHVDGPGQVGLAFGNTLSHE